MRERQLYWQKSIMLISISGPLIHMVLHWWDTLKPSHLEFTHSTLIVDTHRENQKMSRRMNSIRATSGATNDRRFQYVRRLPTNSAEHRVIPTIKATIETNFVKYSETNKIRMQTVERWRKEALLGEKQCILKKAGTNIKSLHRNSHISVPPGKSYQFLLP